MPRHVVVSLAIKRTRSSTLQLLRFGKILKEVSMKDPVIFIMTFDELNSLRE